MKDNISSVGANLLSFYLGGALVASSVIYSLGAPGLTAIVQGAAWPLDIAYFLLQVLFG